jgi:dTDP-4-dehydrorhamnose reductase
VTSPAQHIVVIAREGQVACSLAEILARRRLRLSVVARPEIDLADANGVRAVISERSPNVVINAAAYTAVDRAEDAPDLAFAINARGAEAAALGAADSGAPVIHFSTDHVYAGCKSEPYVEGDETGPIGVYGASKLEGERLVAAANPRHVILRTAWVCSPFGNNFAKTMLRLAASRPKLTVVDDQHGNPTFALDIARAVTDIIPALSSEGRRKQYGVFHCVYNGTVSWCGFARAIMDSAQRRGAAHVPVRAIGTSEYPTKAKRPAYSRLSTDKLHAVYGVRMRPWDAALSDCLDVLLGPVKA